MLLMVWSICARWKFDQLLERELRKGNVSDSRREYKKLIKLLDILNLSASHTEDSSTLVVMVVYLQLLCKLDLCSFEWVMNQHKISQLERRRISSLSMITAYSERESDQMCTLM
ncbi:hypothetical protein HS088_TW21G00247 [Tripterygium wilfordii]|uniref:Uncharacterized protein n=1 Tax=Tripterygium wilfordii TaxID=458696 RepID=A0A7J7C1T1_TRIWF|nr:hypothetical protein HS088_TW21G00247 [Tripterygium wilfordii]